MKQDNMRKHLWTVRTLSFVLTAALLTTGAVPALSGTAAAAEAAVSAEQSAAGADHAVGTGVLTAYGLTDQLQVEVKSLLNETTSEGTRIAVVVRLKSTAAKVAKLPDLELRVRTADGYEYPLQASVFNAHAIRPGTTEELSYMVQVDRRDPLELSELVWYSVDWYSYPKIETVKLAVPVSGMQWNGPLASVSNEALAGLTWGTTFSLAPALESPLLYTPVMTSKDQTTSGPVTTVKLLVKNPSGRKEALPDFTLDGRAGDGGSERTVYSGKRVEPGPVVLEPGEERYIHFAIPTDKSTVLTSIQVLNLESFRQLDAKSQVSQSTYSIGRFGMRLPAGSGYAEYRAASRVEQGQRFEFDSVTDAVDPSLAVSLVELRRHVNEGEGYQTAIAKVMMTNGGDLPIPVPSFQTKLQTIQGQAYNGSRQTGTVAEIMPHTSYVVSYAFNLPEEVEDEEFLLKFTDPKTVAPAVTTIGAYRVGVQREAADLKNMSFYPFHVKLNDWSIIARTNLPSALAPGPITYSYKLMLSMDISREERVIVDQNFSKLSLELVDPTDKVLSVRTLPFTGVNRVISGKQYITFDNLKTDEQYYPLKVNIYETITTATGEAKRLVGVLKQ